MVRKKLKIGEFPFFMNIYQKFQIHALFREFPTKAYITGFRISGP